MSNQTPETYEARCNRLIANFQTDLNEVGQSPVDLKALSDKLEAEVRLADFKFKFRQADHVKWLSYGPLIISVVGTVLALVGVYGLWQKSEETRASLIFKVLDAKPPDDKQYLQFFVNSGMLKLDGPQVMKLEALLDKRKQP